MHVVSLINRKGGSGKTTLAVHLAVAAMQRNIRTALIDLDPQASAGRWSSRREDPEPTVITVESRRLDKELERLRESAYNLVYLDTAPHSDMGLTDAARIAELAVVPCRPSILDIEAMTDTFELLHIYRTRSMVVLNAALPRSQDTMAAQAVIEKLGESLCPAIVHQRVAFMRAFLNGKTVLEATGNKKAAVEIRELHAYLSTQLAETNLI